MRLANNYTGLANPVPPPAYSEVCPETSHTPVGTPRPHTNVRTAQPGEHSGHVSAFGANNIPAPNPTSNGIFSASPFPGNSPGIVNANSNNGASRPVRHVTVVEGVGPAEGRGQANRGCMHSLIICIGYCAACIFSLIACFLCCLFPFLPL